MPTGIPLTWSRASFCDGPKRDVTLSGPLTDPLAFGPWQRNEWLFLLAESNRVLCDKAAALQAAGDAAVERLQMIDEFGEKLDEDDWDEESTVDEPSGSPSPGGFDFHIDMNGAEYWPRPHVTSLRMILEELRRHGATPARIIPTSVAPG